MPELPEVECVRRTLAAHIVGRRVASTRLHRRDYVSGPATGRALLAGAVIADVRRRGKQLAFIADDGRALCAHLGMSGALTWLPPRAQPPRNDHIHVEWRLASSPARSNNTGSAAAPTPAGRLVFRDPRRFGGVWTFPSFAALESERWSTLGPDAAAIQPADLAPRLATRTAALKTVLLDQAAIAGVGNIYADEALFLARIRPTRPADSLRAPDLDRLCRAIRETLAAAIEAGGSSLRDYVNGDGLPGAYVAHHAVYGRAGDPCTVCRRPLAQALVAQRTTVWCRSCQH